jgi:hypothetical protein
MSEGRQASDLKKFVAADVACLIESVDLHASDANRRVVITGERGTINIETSSDVGEVRVTSQTS